MRLLYALLCLLGLAWYACAQTPPQAPVPPQAPAVVGKPGCVCGDDCQCRPGQCPACPARKVVPEKMPPRVLPCFQEPPKAPGGYEWRKHEGKTGDGKTVWWYELHGRDEPKNGIIYLRELQAGPADCPPGKT